MDNPVANCFLKSDWRIVKFGDVVKNMNLVGRDPKANGISRIVGLEHIDPENLHIRRWKTPEDGTSFTRRFVPGQTLFGKRRSYQRKVAYAEFEGICSGDILAFEPKSKKVLLPELLPFICQSDAFFDYALGTSAGSLSPRTSWTALQDFEFSLPPLDEQKRIAEILWAADETVEKYRIVNQDLDKIAGQLITKYFGQKDFSLGEIGDWIGGGTPSKKNKDYWSGEIPWISPKDLKVTELFDSEDHISDEAVRSSSTRVVPRGTILVAFRTGILRHTFPVVIARNEIAINQDLKALFPNEKFVPEFVAGYLMFRSRDILRECVKSGTTVESVDLGLFKKIRIPLPELATQRTYANEAKNLEISRNLITQNSEAIKSTARSLMNAMEAIHV
jgi:type I restriction enzyme S subunit